MCHRNGQRIRCIALCVVIAFFLAFNSICLASPCEESVDVEADIKTSKDSYAHYKGNAQVKSGALIIKADKFSVREIPEPAMTFSLEKATFTFKKDGSTISGYSDRVIFYGTECMLDLIGNVRIDTNGSSHEYGSVRYFLSENKIDPLWLSIDQGIRVSPEKQ